MRKLAIFAVSAACFLPAAHATTITTGAAADDWFSSASTLGGNPSDIFLRTFGYPGVDRSALEFSLSGITGGTVNSALFTIQSRGTAVGGGTFEFWGYSGDGAITAADGTRTGTLIGTLATQDGEPQYNLDVTAFIQSLVDAHANYAGILITVAETGVFLGNDIASSEWDTVSDRPRLSVDFSNNVPEPASAALFGLALAGIAATRRRKH